MAQQRFVELLTKELTDELTSAEKQELELLYNQNPGYKQQSITIKEYWSSNPPTYKANAANFKKVMDAVRIAEQRPEVQSEVNKPLRLWPVLKYAAAVFFLVSVSYLWFQSVSPDKETQLASNWQNTVTAPKMKERLVLPDSTIVTLNSGTSFKYPLKFGGKNREVYLNGEAFFEVHKDAKHPFIIHTNKMKVRVLGTAFNIKSYDKESRSETSLIHGSIEVTLNDRLSDRIILKPREKLIVEDNLQAQKETNITIPRSSDKLNAPVRHTQYSVTNLTYNPLIDSAAVETLWLKNKLVFNNEDFETIAAEMERWYGIQIVFQHEELKKLRFTAPFEQETPGEAFKTLQFTEDFYFKKKGLVYYISNKTPMVKK